MEPHREARIPATQGHDTGDIGGNRGTGYFGTTFWSPPGVPGGAMIGVGNLFTGGAPRLIAASPVGGGVITP
jgi:hypothetical protein